MLACDHEFGFLSPQIKAENLLARNKDFHLVQPDNKKKANLCRSFLFAFFFHMP